jgi:hypothetical protein
MSAADLWSAVVSSYPEQGLIELTNQNDRGAVAIKTSAGENAAQAVINLWPVYAQEDYDATNSTHVEVAKLGVIAVLNRRGGTSTSVEQITWEEVFGPDGAVHRLKRTRARGRAVPVIGGNTERSREGTSDGRPRKPWSDPRSLPSGLTPDIQTADD